MPSWPGVFEFGTFSSVALSNSRCMSALGSFSRPLILFLCNLSIGSFCNVLSVLIFFSKFVLLPLHPIVGLSSGILHRHFAGIFFVILECSILFVLHDPVPLSSESPFRQYIWIYFFKLFFQISL